MDDNKILFIFINFKHHMEIFDSDVVAYRPEYVVALCERAES
jgi:hypothetical protein